MWNILWVDRGTKYLWIAYRNERWKNIAPIGSMMNDNSLFFNIWDILQRYHVTKLVIGYPKNHKDLQKSIDKFIEQVLFIDREIEVVRVDEEYSSVQAAATTWKYEKSTEEDTIAAMKILEEYIDKE